jgi:predicted dehydrogenase
MSQPLRIGVIGAGARGETFARQLYQGTRRATLFGVCDLDEDRLARFCDFCELTDAPRYTETVAFLAEPDLDAVIITVPEFAHREVAVAAMAAGKHVYLEKPLAHTLEDCHAIAAAAAANDDVVAYVGFNLRAAAARQKLHDIVASGELGQIVHLSGMEQLHRPHGAAFMRRFYRRSEQSGGLMNHKCCHDLDILLWVAGHQHRVSRISSFGGCNVLRPDRQPATHCHKCPSAIYEACPYKARSGFVFPVHGDTPIYHRASGV